MKPLTKKQQKRILEILGPLDAIEAMELLSILGWSLTAGPKRKRRR